MSIVLDQVRLDESEEQLVKSESARAYLKMLKLERELKKEIKEFSQKLQKDEIQSISQYFNVPKYLTVREVANLTGVSQQIVRRHCASEKYKGYQASGANGTWHIESEQFNELPGFMDFISKRNDKFEKTKKAAELTKDMINEEINNDGN
ncbi:hypothetical protein J9317_02100 [Metabacillus sp. KIGAM252]|uniref:DNA-binding protein n=1 Tax=Metabacillus flavus TaxID=2823519 RepID=A0ABS5LA13_9BACI|nr:hypothetical protein [Metabacillus flavus]MBS2967565.1 hypothetical protein [Metabacillus flavus]